MSPILRDRTDKQLNIPGTALEQCQYGFGCIMGDLKYIPLCILIRVKILKSNTYLFSISLCFDSFLQVMKRPLQNNADIHALLR